jgi:polypeptide N-acetylgalactosaminyltransferase
MPLFVVGKGRIIGSFDWMLAFRWMPMPKRVIDLLGNAPSEPYPSPTMAGGLLAADRRYFFEMGGYDDGMESNDFFYHVSLSAYFKLD